jgi:uncharacterized membrane protein
MTILSDSEKSTSVGTDSLSRKVGLFMAGSSTFFGFLYLLGLGVNLFTSASFYPSGSDVKYISAVVAILWNLALVALFATLRREAEPSRAILAELALVFAILVCATSCTSWFLGMTAYPRFALTVDPGTAAMLDPYNPSSLSYALEHLGWGLFFGLTTVLAGLALEPRSTSNWLRWSLVVTGILSLGHFLGVLISNDAIAVLGFVSWGVALPISSALLAAMFRRKLKRPSIEANNVT